MSAPLYCSRSDVTKRLPPGTLGSIAGIAASSKASSDAFEFDGHGLETGDAVLVRALDGASLSSPLAAGTTYYVKRLTSSTFQLSATNGGSAINLTTDAVDVIVCRDPDFDYWIGFYSRWADDFFPAHAVPFGVTEAVPALVAGLVADLVAKRMFNVGGQGSQTLNDVELAAKAQLERYAKGMAIRGETAPARTNLAVVSTLVATADPRGWGSGSLP